MMKRVLGLLLVAPMVLAQAPAAKAPPTLRSVLLAQLRSTHNKAEWFVPINTAIAGMTPEQAKWVPPAMAKNDPLGSHSAGQLAYHLWFWDNESLKGLRGEKGADVKDNNETFNNFDEKSWAELQVKLDAVLTEIEKWVETADEASLLKNAGTIAHIGTHNAYHVGQILYVRKLAGNWDPKKGVQ